MKAVLNSVTLAVFFAVLNGCGEANLTPSAAEHIETDGASLAIPKYEPVDQALYDTILAMDHKYFDAYNTCDLETQAEIIADDMEFYHDQGGLLTDKATLIQSLKDNICDKVTRQYLEGSMEVYPIAGYGAVAEGYHSFTNALEPDAPPKPSKFIGIWKETEEGWKMTRIISLH